MPLPHQNGFKILKNTQKTLKNTHKHSKILNNKKKLLKTLTHTNFVLFFFTERKHKYPPAWVPLSTSTSSTAKNADVASSCTAFSFLFVTSFLGVLLSRVRIETEINVDNLPKFNKTEITSGEQEVTQTRKVHKIKSGHMRKPQSWTTNNTNKRIQILKSLNSFSKWTVTSRPVMSPVNCFFLFVFFCFCSCLSGTHHFQFFKLNTDHLIFNFSIKKFRLI